MATTIVTKSGSGAPTASDLVAGELAVDLTNKRLYTEDSGGTVLELGTNPASNVTFGDNTKAIFGAGSDLQIYSDGTQSYISDQGAGSLFIRSGSNIYVQNAGGTANYFKGTDGGAAELFHNGSSKLATTNTGIDVAGSVTAESLGIGTSLPRSLINASSATGAILTLESSDTSLGEGDVVGQINFYANDASTNSTGNKAFIKAYSETAGGNKVGLEFATSGSNSATGVTAMTIDSDGDISFYEDTGTTPKFYWDASSEYLGIGTDSPTQPLNVLVPDNSGVQIESAAGHKAYLFFGDEASNTVGRVGYDHATDTMGLWTASAEVVVIDSSGIDVTGSVTADGLIVDGNGSTTGVLTLGSAGVANAFINSADSLYINIDSNNDQSGGNDFQIARNSTGTAGQKIFLAGENGDISFYEDTGTTPKFYWDASAESLGIGTTPDAALHVVSSTVAEFKVGNIGPSNNSAIRVSRNDTTVTTGNPLGYLEFGGNDSTSNLDTAFAYVGAEASGTHAAGNNPTELVFGTTDNNAGAPVKRMTIDSSGRVGIGTDSPSEELTIRSSVPKIQIEDSDGTNQYGQFYHSAGITAILARNDTSDGTIVFQKYDGTTTDETMRIDASGNLLVGTTVSGGVGATIYNPAGVGRIDLNKSFSGAATAMGFYYNGGQVGSITYTDTSTSFNTSSDQRLKENIADAPSASDDIDAIQVRSFDWKADGEHQKYGMIAQELQTVAPEAVSGNADSEEMMGVDYSKLVPMMLKEIQSLRARVAQLES
jgi:hypothetical protein